MRKLKNTKITLATTLVICFALGVVCIGSTYGLTRWRTLEVQQKLKQIDTIVDKYYIGDIEKQSVADAAATGYVSAIADKWSGYIPAEEYKTHKLLSEGKTCGIGVSVVMHDGEIKVSEVYDDSPAMQAGIEKGDKILGAGEITVESDGTDAVVDMISGEEGTEVTVTVWKAKTERSVALTMTRSMVTQKMAWGEILEGQIGYIRINRFRVGSAEQYQNALDKLIDENASALIIDVRHNGGGRVNEMSEMLDPLLPEGTIMTLRTKEGKETVYESGKQTVDLPIVVLADDESISAAEFFAAALQEYERATFVGEHTSGKGRAQQTFELKDGSALVLSVEEYFTPKGNNLAETGIAPDVEVILTEEEKKDFFFLTTENDPQLQKAMEILRK